MKNLLAFLRKEPVLCVAAFAALISMFFVPPSLSYLDYIDFRVLGLLFCLMAVVLGFRSCGLFDFLAGKLLTGEKSLRQIGLLLILLPFFSSMLVTNDVALITFVPFAILVLRTVHREDQMIPVIVFQTIAANLGSMATPIGNPQNLFLYARYELAAADFFLVTVPLTLISLFCLLLMNLRIPKDTIRLNLEGDRCLKEPKKLAVYGVLFLLCLLSVFRVLPWQILTVVLTAAMLLLNRRLLLQVDYGLLITFVFFFLFSGNMGNIPALKEVISSLLEKNTLITSIVTSQFISNVPAAVLLAEFTENWKELLAGVNLGGLGTLIASLASLISFKFYAAEKSSRTLSYLGVFTFWNVLLLIFLTAITMVFYGSAIF